MDHLLAKALGWTILITAWPIVKAIAWWDERSLDQYSDLERDVRKDDLRR
jgi:glycerol kinase